MSRAVMFVLNDCRTDARVLREAASLASAGHQVTIIARTSDPYTDRGEREDRGAFEIVRVPVASGALRWLLLVRRPRHLVRALLAAAPDVARGSPLRRLVRGAGSLALACVGVLAVLPAMALGVALVCLLAATRVLPPLGRAWSIVDWRLRWRFGVMAWSAAAAAAAPPADILHAHDMNSLPAAIAARRRGKALVVYDSHEVFVEAGSNARRPPRARAAMRALERDLAAQAAALVTVNEDIAALLGAALDMQDRIVVVRNLPPRWDPGPVPERRFHAALGLEPGARVLLFHGGLERDRGIEQLLALRGLPGDAHLVLLGYGSLRPWLAARLAAEPSLAARVHLLEAVSPGELRYWVASADVVLVPYQPTNLNHRLATPNKLFEALGAGVPVVASDFPALRRVVLDDPDGPLGAVCDPTDPAALATAIRSLLDLPPEAMADLRRRCLRAAHERYCWEIDEVRLLGLYRRLATGLVPPGRTGAGG